MTGEVVAGKRPGPLRRVWNRAMKHRIWSSIITTAATGLAVFSWGVLTNEVKGDKPVLSNTVLSTFGDTGFTVGFPTDEPPVGDLLLDEEDEFAPARWAHEHDGAELGTIQRRIVFQAADKGVVISQVRARVLEDELDPATVVVKDLRFGVVADVVFAAIDLDADNPIAVDYTLGGDPGPPFFATKNVELLPGESDTFDFFMMSGTCDCSFELVVDMIVEGKQRQTTIRDADGEPFRIGVVPDVSDGGGVWETGPCEDGSGLVWVPLDPDDERDCLPFPG